MSIGALELSEIAALNHTQMSRLIFMNLFQLNNSRSRRLAGCGAIVAVSWLGFLEFVTPVAASNREQVAPTSDRAWTPPNQPAYENALRKGSADALERGKDLVDPRKEYTLPDLIDLAERLNPATRAAWESARQALALVGVSKSAYYPFLSIAAEAGYTRLFVPFPKLEVNQAALQRVFLPEGRCNPR